MKRISSKRNSICFALFLSLLLTFVYVPNFSMVYGGEGGNRDTNPGLTNEAKIGEKYYPKLTDAIQAAKDGDLIKLISVDSNGAPKSIEIGETWVNKKITIDMNGRDIINYGYSLCLYENSCDLNVINSDKEPANLGGIIYNFDNEAKLRIGDNVEIVNDIRVNKNTVIDGNHIIINLLYDTALNNGKLYSVTFGDSYHVSFKTNISFENQDIIDDLNDSDKPVNDILIAKNANKKIASAATIQEVNNPAVKLRLDKNGDLYIHKDISKIFYLDGRSGNDTNDGKSIDTPVKSIDKIKKMVKDPSLKDRKKIVYVIGTVSIKDNQSLEFKDDSNIEFYRHKAFENALFDIEKNGKLSISNLTLDGNKQNVWICKSPLISVTDGTVDIKDGAILQNNSYTSFGINDMASGGAIRALKGSEINISGGIIRLNKASAGGGVHAANATVNMTGGIITENELMSPSDDHFSTGGGICAAYGSKVKISGGTISDNKASHGGGLSLGFYGVDNNFDRGKTILTMTGGKFENNAAEKCGGGIFVQGGSDFAQTQSIAYIKAGTFTNNTAEKGLFAGGAIYVNGWHGDDRYSSGELHLENALIKDNTSKDPGGGYASCPTARTFNRINNGVAIFGNTGNGGADMSIHANVLYNGGYVSPPYELSPEAFGGGLNRWIIDQQLNNGSNGKPLSLNAYAGYLPLYTELSVKSGMTEKEKKAAEKLAKVKIIKNKAGGYGGGIASNGDVYFGNGDTIDLTVKKTWNDEKIKEKRPKKIKVGIYRAIKGKSDSPVYIGSGDIYPDRNGNWSLTFKKLPKGNESGDYIYTAKEINTDNNNYLQESSGSVTGKSGTIEIKNTYEEINLKVKKIWEDAGDKDKKRPKSITVRLLKNKKEIASKILNTENGWSITFENLPKYQNGKEISYTVSEKEVKGYETRISKEGEYGFIITNIHKTDKPKTPKTPKPNNPKPQKPKVTKPSTGDNNYPALYIGLLTIGVTVLLVLRLKRKNAKRD